jgi:hypothetical protein
MTDHKDQQMLLHLLRNPSGWSEDTIRDARRKAADELQRLWGLEMGVRVFITTVNPHD